uniref:Tubulin/FtsZ GTPase domain-containing protein n=1 Tax=Mola mola TaxID=94237 RepID=A0A3Q3XMD1_MOLML
MREIVHIQAGQCGNQIGTKLINTSPGLCWSTWNQGPWTACAREPSDNSSDQTTSSLVRGTTGPRVTTRRGRSSWTRY